MSIELILVTGAHGLCDTEQVAKSFYLAET